MILKQITFHFENCECITINGKYIGEFLVDEISNTVSKITTNSVREINVTKLFKIEIHKDANIEYCKFSNKDYKSTVFERFEECGDITNISFELGDKDGPMCIYYEYYLDWVGDSHEVNEAQKTYRSDLGNLYIVVSKEKDICDVFNMDYINDENAIKYNFDLE